MTNQGRLDRMKRTRRRDSRGASLVEAAIVMLPLCLIIFGIIEFGLLFKDQLSMSNAARAGARTASAEPLDSGFYDDTVASVTRGAAGVGFNNGDTLCIFQVRPNPSNSINPTGALAMSNCDASHHARKYTWSGNKFVSGNTASIFASFGTGTPGPDVCLGDPDVDSVGVNLKVAHHSITGFFGTVNINEHTTMRLEPQQSADTCGQ